MPFKELEMLMAHQTPLMPNPKAVKPIAIGIRRKLKTILIIAGGTVRPVP